MRIEFQNGGYIETAHAPTPGKIFVIIGAKNANNALEMTVNSVEITQDQFNQLVAGFIPNRSPAPAQETPATEQPKTKKKKSEKKNG